MTYEFTETENVEFQGFSNSLIYLTTSIITLGIFGIVTVLTQEFTSDSIIGIIVSLLIMIMGSMLVIPTRNFRRIVKTEGNDIQELMTAFNRINTGLTFLIGVTIVLFIAILISIVLSAVGVF